MVRNSTTLCVKYNTHEHIQGEDSVEYFLGLTPSGIIVLRNKSTVAHYYWPRISKVYFKGRYFMIRVCDKNVSTKTEPQLARMLMDSWSVLRENRLEQWIERKLIAKQFFNDKQTGEHTRAAALMNSQLNSSM